MEKEKKQARVSNAEFAVIMFLFSLFYPLINIALSLTGRVPGDLDFFDKGTVLHNIHHPSWTVIMVLPYIIMYYFRDKKIKWLIWPYKLLITASAVINGINLFVKIYDIPYLIIVIGMTAYFMWFLLHRDEARITEELGDYPLAFDPAKKVIFPGHYFSENTHIIGSTGSGKTHFVIKPLIEQTIQQRLGCLVLDVKSNLYKDVIFYAEQAKRLEKVRYFDLANPDMSDTYNPLYGNDPDEVANRVFTALYCDFTGEPFYKELASAFLSNLVGLLMTEIKTITFQDLATATGELGTFKTIHDFCLRHPETQYAQYFRDLWLDMPVRERQTSLTGLVNKLQRFCTREWSPIINVKRPRIHMEDVLSEDQIFILGIHSMMYSEDAKPLAVMAMMDLSSQIARRFLYPCKVPFRVFLDEFYNIAFPGFINLINKCRETNVNLFLAHQSLGDLRAVSQEFKEQIMNTARNKIILGVDDPETAEKFAKLLGTEPDLDARVYSYDAENNLAGVSIPQVEKFRFHPNEIKEMPVGQAIIRLVPKVGLKTFRTVLRTATPLPDRFNPFIDRRAVNLKKEPNQSSVREAFRPPIEAVKAETRAAANSL